MITYLLIGLAHTIILGILLTKFYIKNDWVSTKENTNNLYNKVGINCTLFSGEEAYRSFCLGLIALIFVWPLLYLWYMYCIIRLKRK